MTIEEKPINLLRGGDYVASELPQEEVRLSHKLELVLFPIGLYHANAKIPLISLRLRKSGSLENKSGSIRAQTFEKVGPRST